MRKPVHKRIQINIETEERKQHKNKTIDSMEIVDRLPQIAAAMVHLLRLPLCR